jgi:protease I
MMISESDKGLAIVLAEDLYEDLELQYPRLRLIEAGYKVQVAGADADKTYTSKHGYPVTSDVAFDEVDPDSVKILIVPGGYAPDRLRRHASCLRLVSKINESGGIIGVICHGGWVPISARIVEGRRMTSWPSLRDDLENAGVHWVDEACVTDGNMVTSRNPDDLPAFMQGVLALAESEVEVNR